MGMAWGGNRLSEYMYLGGNRLSEYMYLGGNRLSEYMYLGGKTVSIKRPISGGGGGEWRKP